MVLQARPLIEVLAEIPDFRSNHGKRYRLRACVPLMTPFRTMLLTHRVVYGA